MSIQLQPPVLPVSQVKTETLTVIKNEPPASKIVKAGVDNILDLSDMEVIPDIKDIDIVWHPLCEDSIKSETVRENILETKHPESEETQVFVKTENSPFVKIENITESENLNKTEDISDGNSQGVLEVQGSNEHLKDKEDIKVIEAPVIRVEPDEYTSISEDRHVCNHCQYMFHKLKYVKRHIETIHREVTRMYQCPYCLIRHKSKWSVQCHIIRKHKDAKDIQWFRCHLCEKKFKLLSQKSKHMKIHLTQDQMEGRLNICRVCGKGFKERSTMRNHMIFVHNIEEWSRERKCQECEYTTTENQLLKHHIKSTHKKYEKRYCCEKCTFVGGTYSDFKSHELSHKTKAEIDNQDLKYCCDKCNYKSYRHDNFKEHKLIHLKSEDSQRFCCYHCSYKAKRKDGLKRHILLHFKNETVPFHCYICDFMTRKRDVIIEHFKKHTEHHSKCDKTKYKYQLETLTKKSEIPAVQVFVKTENSPFVKIENITESANLNKPEDISGGNSQRVLEVQGSNEHFNTLVNVETDQRLIHNFSNDLRDISTSSRKAKHPENTDFADCYKTVKTNSWVKDKEKIKVIEAPVIQVEPDEYTSIAEDRHVCNHCQYVFHTLKYLKCHIKKMHREVTRMFKCPYCPHKSKWSVREHIIQKHKDAKDIQWFQCNLCEKKFKLKSRMSKHMKIHLTQDQMEDKLKKCRVCGKGFKTRFAVRRHMIFVHNIEEWNKERKCPECEYTTNENQLLKYHIKSTHKKHEKRYCCEKCTFVSGKYSDFKSHELSHKTKADIDNQDLKYYCNKCNYKSYRHDNFKEHKLIHLKPEETQYFYCYHCSYKAMRKESLKRHILSHFKKHSVTKQHININLKLALKNVK